MSNGIYEPLLVVQQSVTTTPAALSNIPANAVRALITVETQNIRFSDFAPPTTSFGLPLAKDQPPFPYEGYLDKLMLVAQTGTATVHIAYYGKRPENVQ